MGWRCRLYERLALGWTGTPRQWQRLERAIGVMAVLVIPIAVSVHTVVSWVFAMTIQPMWHSTIFGPYFVVGAIFSGIAAILTAMVIVGKVYHLEQYLQPIHFNNLGILLPVMTCLWFYFTSAEHLTTWYGQEPPSAFIGVPVGVTVKEQPAWIGGGAGPQAGRIDAVATTRTSKAIAAAVARSMTPS